VHDWQKIEIPEVGIIEHWQIPKNALEIKNLFQTKEKPEEVDLSVLANILKKREGAYGWS
jgi:hypothetical protein